MVDVGFVGVGGRGMGGVGFGGRDWAMCEQVFAGWKGM